MEELDVGRHFMLAFLFFFFLVFHSDLFLLYCLVCGPLFLPSQNLLVVSIHFFLCMAPLCLSFFFPFTGSQRYRVVREPIFISVFLFYTQTQVTGFLFHLFCLSLLPLLSISKCLFSPMNLHCPPSFSPKCSNVWFCFNSPNISIL